MSRDTNGRARLLEEARADMFDRLRARQQEIEVAILASVLAISGSVESEDTQYQVGLRAAVAAVLDYVLTGIEQGEEWSGPVPSAAVTQARRAARSGVNLDTLVLRYIAGHRLLGEFVMDEADRSGYSNHSQALRELRSTQEALLQSLMAAVANEHRQEVERAGQSDEQPRKEHVQKLLAGGPVDATEMDYEFDGWHLGVIATGAGAEKTVRRLANDLGRQLLLVSCGEGTTWAWFGGYRRLAVADVERILSSKGTASVSLAIGEPGQGIDGWRLTHMQAQAALLVALHDPRSITPYSGNMLLAAALRDKTLARSLEDSLSPLNSHKDGGATLRQTLREYLAHRHNATTTASTLGVERRTVHNHVRAIEQKLGCLLHACQAELEVALRLIELREVVHDVDSP